MSKALIITSYVDGLDRVTIEPDSYDYVICADGGFLIAQKLEIKADLLIGDYDSMNQPENPCLIKLPIEKDMTDSEAAIDLAVSKGFDFIQVLGGLGGRLDHTMGNLGILAKYSGTLRHLAFFDGQNYVFMIQPGTIHIPKNSFNYLGVVNYSTCNPKVTLRGVKYPLTDHNLTNTTTLGVSNEIVEEYGSITFTDGKLLIILSKDIDKK